METETVTTLELAVVHAEKMLGTAVPPSLYRRLQRVDEFCTSAGAALLSRQLIAVVVDQWSRDMWNSGGKAEEWEG